MEDRSHPAQDLAPVLKALQAPEGQVQDLIFQPTLHQQLAPSERSISHFDSHCPGLVSLAVLWQNVVKLLKHEWTDLLAGCTHLKGDEAVWSPHVVRGHPTSKPLPPLVTTMITIMMMMLQVTIGVVRFPNSLLHKRGGEPDYNR